MRGRWPQLLLILAPLLALWPGLTGLAIGPFDQIRQMAPWNGPKPSQPWDVLMADSVLQSHVWRTMVLDAWGKGQLPLWNPYEFAGTPLLANSQSGGFYPPHIVLGLLHVGAGLAGFLLAWFHLALAGLGLYALVRRLGGSKPAGLTGGLLFSLSPFMLGWAPLSSVVSTVAWIPLALACVVDLFESGGATVIRKPFSTTVVFGRTGLALAACVGMMLLAGHLQFAAYGLGSVALLSLGYLAIAKKKSTILSIAIASLLGVGLAAPQLLPVLSYSKESHRRNSPTEEGYQAYLGTALRPFELANLGHPMALGSPREPVDVGGTTIAAYWPTLVKPGANFAESAISLGAVALALLFAAPWRRRETWPLAALGIIALLLALGTPLNRLLYFVVPGWSSTGSPGRIEVLFLIAACALAGLAVDRITKRKAQIAAGAGLLTALLLAFVLPTLAPAEGAAAALRGAATTGILPSLLVALLLAAVALFLAKRSSWTVPAGAALVALLTHATGLIPFGKPLDIPKGDPNVRIAVVNDAWEIPIAAPALMPPNVAALGGLHELSGYDSLTSRDAVELLRTVNGGTDPAPPANGNMMLVKPTLDPKALAACGVTEVWSKKPLPQLGSFEQRDGYVVQKVDGPGRVTNGTVIDGYDRQEVIGSHPGDVVVRDRFTLGWDPDAKGLDNFPLRDIGQWRNYSSTSKEITIRTTVKYRPSGLEGGMMIGAVCWLILLAVFAFTRLAVSIRPPKPVSSDETPS